jgi:transposase-like protein
MAEKKFEKWLQKENLILLEGWRRDGLDYDQIAHNMGIARGTLSKWREQYKDIGDALKRGSEVSNYEIENAMYKAAIGYDTTETEQVETTNPDGTTTVTKRARRRHVPPNVTAQIFILKNRRGDVWRDKQVVEQKNDGMLAQLIDGLVNPDATPQPTEEKQTEKSEPEGGEKA